MRRRMIAALTVVSAVAAAPAAAAEPVTPIPGTPDSTYVGHAATAHPIRGVARTPQNPVPRTER